MSICSGPGTSPANRPMPTPPATELRLRCHRLGWVRNLPKRVKYLLSRTLSWVGRYLRKNLRGMAKSLYRRGREQWRLTKVVSGQQDHSPEPRTAGGCRVDRDQAGGIVWIGKQRQPSRAVAAASGRFVDWQGATASTARQCVFDQSHRHSHHAKEDA